MTFDFIDLGVAHLVGYGMGVLMEKLRQTFKRKGHYDL